MKGVSTILAIILIVMIICALMFLAYTFAVGIIGNLNGVSVDYGHWECIAWDYKTLNCTCNFLSKENIRATVNKNLTGEACGTDTSLTCNFGGGWVYVANCTTKNITVNWDCEPNKYCTKQEWVKVV